MTAPVVAPRVKPLPHVVLCAALPSVENVAPGHWRAPCPICGEAVPFGYFETAPDGYALCLGMAPTCRHRPGDVLRALNLNHADLLFWPHDVAAWERAGQDLDAALGEVGVVRATIPSDEMFPRAVPASDLPDSLNVPWIVDGLLPEGEVAFLFGDGGSRKTTTALALAVAVASGTPAFAHFPTTRAPVLFISEEDGAPILRNRLAALVRGLDAPPATLSAVHVLALAGLSLGNAASQAHVRAEMERTGARLLILDPLGDLLDGDENSNSDARAPLKLLRALASAHRAAVLVLHHAAKPREGVGTSHRLRGASAWANGSRATFWLEETETGGRVECLKMSRAPKPAPFALRHDIEADATNPAAWVRASLTHEAARAATLDRAEGVVARIIAAAVAPMTTTEVRTLAGREGVTPVDCQRALTRLAALARITYDPGPRGAKRWRVNGVPF